MAESPNDRSRLMTQTANHLRLVQMDFADERADVRKGYLADELARAMAAVTPEERRVFLLDLLGQFPSWDMPDPAPPSEPTTTDWRGLVARLEALAPSLPAAERAAMGQRLQELGLVAPAEATEPAQPAESASSKELVRVLRDFALHVEKLWEVWAKLSSNGTLRPSGNLRDDINNVLNGNKAGAAQLNQDLDRLVRLLVATTGTVGRLDHLFQSHMEQSQLTPQAIRDLVENEGKKGLLGSTFAFYWTRYEQQYNKVRSNLGKDFQGKIVQLVESWFQKKPDR